MCTHFTPTQDSHWVEQNFGVALPPDYPTDVFPGYLAPIIVKSRQSGRVACGAARFGLIPHWAKDSRLARHTYNARCETVAEKPSFRTAWRNRQLALLPVDDFYEPCYETGRAVAWKIRQASGMPLCIGCLWDRWTDPQTGLLVVSFSMLTVNADSHPVMNRFHKPGDEKRTPVLIAPEHFQAWLEADLQAVRPLLDAAMLPPLQACAWPK